ncbi:hypothetical protein, partial [Salinimicrobium oceani]|uniref:hypothetical protein n=1 Tax=Salinimicrobium oceani TaxID=2722702 RepID=UPI001ADD7D94
MKKPLKGLDPGLPPFGGLEPRKRVWEEDNRFQGKKPLKGLELDHPFRRLGAPKAGLEEDNRFQGEKPLKGLGNRLPLSAAWSPERGFGERSTSFRVKKP